jgi:hypothetical protein
MINLLLPRKLSLNANHRARTGRGIGRHSAVRVAARDAYDLKQGFQGNHGEPVEPSFDKLRMTASNFVLSHNWL